MSDRISSASDYVFETVEDPLPSKTFHLVKRETILVIFKICTHPPTTQTQSVYTYVDDHVFSVWKVKGIPNRRREHGTYV